ncbi:MAG: DNA-processing protein DprA, partial [Cyanobacteria bacterium J06641_5]
PARPLPRNQNALATAATVPVRCDRAGANVAAARSRLDPAAIFANYLQKNPDFWTPADAEYPRLLAEIPGPPPLLHYRGTVDRTELTGARPAVAIVGTRDPSEYGRRWTRRLATTLAQHGFTVVSGMAAGIDGEAHRAALEAGGRTIAVLGSGIDLIYPPQHQHLYRDILAGGLVMSEYPAGQQPNRKSFPARNRIIAGLTRATLIIEAPQRSGALITARYANEFGRDVYVLPGSLDEERAMGCLGLLSRGAQAILGEGHLLELLGTMPQMDLPQLEFPLQNSSLGSVTPTPPPPDLEPHLTAVLEAIDRQEVPFEQIVSRAGLAAGEVSAAIVQLELLGLVAQLPGARYRRT